MRLEEIPYSLHGHVVSQFIPHSGRMALLDQVREYDEKRIVCATRSHLDPFNPLRIDNKLSAIHTIEYGAQAASTHTALTALKRQTAPEGINEQGIVSAAFLVVVRDFSFCDRMLDSFKEDLVVTAELIMSGPRSLQYKIWSHAAGFELSFGTVSLMMEG